MPIIRSCTSLINNILKNEKTSYSPIKTEQTGKMLNRKISPANTPVKLLSFRNADLTAEKIITENVLSMFSITRDCLAVRLQSNQFTDLKNKTIQGHKNTVAQVIDWYNPRKNAFDMTTGTPRRSADIAKEESRNALNFMIMEKNIFNEKILNSDANLQKNTAQQKIVAGL